MHWIKTWVKVPNRNDVVMLDCDYGILPGCYVGNDKWKLQDANITMTGDMVYGWVPYK